MAAIDIRTQLVIDQINLDAKAKRDLDDIKRKMGITPGSGDPAEKEFDKAARRRGFDKGETVQPTNFQKIGLAMMNPLGVAMKGLTSVLEMGLKNSKIVQVFVKKVGEALGLL